MELKILSFNIRCANDPDGHSIAERAPRVAAVLKDCAPDIIGFQEYHRRWESSWETLSAPSYEEMIVDRGDGEGNVLRWRSDRFETVTKGHFWFADDPHIPSADRDEKYHKPRICAYAVLKDKATGTVFSYMNVHYGFGAEGHKKNAELLRAFAQKLGGHPVVIAGDFNMTPGTPGYQAMAKIFTDVNMATAKLEADTFHGYGKKTGRCLDYCFVTHDVIPGDYEIITKTFEGKYPSDHYPVAIRLEIAE